MQHPSDDTEDTSRSGLDILNEMMFMGVVDPRPIRPGNYAKRFMRKLKVNGFLVKNITPGEFEHLERTLNTWIRCAIYDDRKDRITP